MKVLFINHNFSQDIEELISARYKKYDFRWILPSYFSQEARKFLPKAIFDNGLAEYHLPKYKLARHKWSKAAPKALYRLYQIYPFDVIVSPSDTFFYIRDIVDASRNLGVPFIVAQKETTISPGTMNFHSKKIKELFPFISDYMTVCSKRHKKFWLNAGACNEKIEITGQPRFDFYCKPKKWQSLKELGFPIDPNKKVVLFFTYHLDAYLPKGQTWKELREDTENVLASLAKENYCNVIIKPHPQHNDVDIEYFSSRLKLLSGSSWLKYIFVTDRKVDARQLIVNSDIVIAFQTTALLESLAVAKRVIYTFWGETSKKFESYIIPYNHYSKIINCVHSPEELRKKIMFEKDKISDESMRKRMNLFREYLGILDGKASERTWQVIERVINSYPSISVGQIRLRKALRRKKYIYCKQEMVTATATKFFWQLSFTLLKLLKFKSDDTNGIVKRIERQKNRIIECKEVINNSSSSCKELIGHINERFFDSFKGWFLNRFMQK